MPPLPNEMTLAIARRWGSPEHSNQHHLPIWSGRLSSPRRAGLGSRSSPTTGPLLPSTPRHAEEVEEAETAAAAAEQGDEASPTARSLVVVMTVLPDSMAARHEGLQPGMVLSSVQGEPVAGETFKPTMKLIKGAGRPVVLGFATMPAALGDGTNGAPPRHEAQFIPLGELAPPKPRRKKRGAHASSAPPPPATPPPPPPAAPLVVLNADESEHETAIAAGARAEVNEEAEEEDEFGFAIGGYFSP
eukprot:COSAG06_NODE_17377_length_945_cov_0.926714_1_plen_245_part_10